MTATAPTEQITFDRRQTLLLMGAAVHSMETLIQRKALGNDRYTGVYRLFHSAARAHRRGTPFYFEDLDSELAALESVQQFLKDYQSVDNQPSLGSRLIVAEMDAECFPEAWKIRDLIAKLETVIHQSELNSRTSE